ncbi:MAG: hypothetical protein NTV34_12235 [Proteobacteria bacterium]|nr:hypothetical protein [Pseudomonadota bacterium]
MIRVHSLLLILIITLFGAHPSLAGVWTSGGSELIKDAANPWFLQNTTDVTTCIIVDQSTFHTINGRPGDLSNAIKSALDYWKQEFAKSWSVGKLIKVATQNFTEGPVRSVSADGSLKQKCPKNTDLTFQFGWLSKEQQQWLLAHGHHPGDLVAITVRSDYDQVKMKGRGFIFVAGDRGPWAIQDAALVKSPWQLGTGKLLVEILKHEFGHIFGLPHMGIEGPMAADYAERLLHKNAAEQIAKTGSNQPFFKIDGTYTLRNQCYPVSSGMRKGWREFLGAPVNHHCLKAQLESDQIIFFTGSSLEQLEERGTLKFEGDERYSWQDAVRIYVPDNQAAMKCPDPNMGAGGCPWLVGPMIKIIDRAGTFVSKDKQLKRQVAVTLSPLGLGFAQAKFSAEIDGKWHWNLDWEY